MVEWDSNSRTNQSTKYIDIVINIISPYIFSLCNYTLIVDDN